MPTPFHGSPLSLQTLPTFDDGTQPDNSEDLPTNDGPGDGDSRQGNRHVSSRAKGQRQKANAVAIHQTESDAHPPDGLLKTATMPVSDIEGLCATVVLPDCCLHKTPPLFPFVFSLYLLWPPLFTFSFWRFESPLHSFLCQPSSHLVGD